MGIVGIDKAADYNVVHPQEQLVRQTAQNTDKITEADAALRDAKAVRNETEKADTKIQSGVWNLKWKPENRSIEAYLSENKEKKSVREITAAIQEKFASAAGRLSGQDCAELEQEGTDYKNQNADELEKAIDRVKQQRAAKGEALDRQIEQKKENRADVESMALSGAERQIADKLEQSGLPVTKENISRFDTALRMADTAGSMTEESYTYLLGKEKELTIHNIFDAVSIASGQYSRAAKEIPGGEAEPSKTAAWNAVAGQAGQIVADAGYMAGTEEYQQAMQDAEWLFMQELPVTQENLYGLQELRQLQESAGTQEFKEQVYRRTADAVSAGKDTGEARLGEVYERISEQAVLKFQKMDFADLDSLTAHRQLEEIRLKMTAQAGVSLLEKGIKLDTEHLSDIVEGLRELEQQYAKSLLSQEGAKATQENLSLFQDVLDQRDSFAHLPAYALGDVYSSQGKITLGEVYEEGRSLQVKMEQAGEAYDQMRTEIRSDMGDSLGKAFRNMDPLLAELGIELTEENRRAVRILSYNHMEINDESAERMKYYDSKVNSLLEDMKPAVVAKMIKEQVNPFEMPMNELEETIHSYGGEEAQEEDFAKFLWKLDKRGELSGDERKSYIGIYRLMNQIQKSDGAAIGAVVNSDQEVTLKNMLTAVRTAKSGGLDTEINEEHGALEQLSFSGERISEQILSAFGNTAAASEQPERSEKRKVQAAEEAAYQDSKADEVRDIIRGSETAVRFLSHYGIEESLTQVEAAKELLSGQNKLYRFLNDLEEKEELEQCSEEVLDSMTGEAEAREAGSRMEEFLLRKTEEQKLKPELTSLEFQDLVLAGHTAALTGSLSKKDYYEIPIVTNGEVTKLNITLENGSGETGKIDISIELPELGRIQAGITVKKDSVTAHFICSDREGLDRLEGDKTSLKEVLEGQTGKEVTQLAYLMEGNRREAAYEGNKADGEQSWKNLYQTAKAVVNYIRDIERAGSADEN